MLENIEERQNNRIPRICFEIFLADVSAKSFLPPYRVNHSLFWAIIESYICIYNFIYIAPYFFLSICLPNQTVSFAKLGWCFIISLLLTPSNIPCPEKGSIHFCSNGKLSKLTILSKCKITYTHRLSLADITNKAICYILDLRQRFLMWLLMCFRKWGHSSVK